MQVNFSIQPLKQTEAVARNKEKNETPQSAKNHNSFRKEPVEAGKLERLKNVLAEKDISLKFHRDERTGQMVIELIDDKTGDAVRQIPSEVSLKLSEVFAKIQGQFIDQKV